MYLSIKAYQVYKKVQKENGEDKQVVKDNLNQMYRQLKLMITLLVNILGSTIVAVIVVTTYHYASMISEGPSVLKHMILPNLPYLNMLLHPLVYGLYFRKISSAIGQEVEVHGAKLQI